jgi:fatty acid desaturase
MAARRSWLPIVLLAAAVAAFAAALVVPGLETGVLFLAPAIVVLAMLLTGHYVGEQQLHRLAAAWQQRRPSRERAGRQPLTPRRPRARMPRGGRLVATSLAVRPPPLLHAVR